MRASATITGKRLLHKGDEPHLLQQITRIHQVLMTGFSRIVGVPASRFELMRLLALAEKDVGVMDLARQLGVNPAAVTRQVKEMEADGLVRRRADSKDGRRNYVALSAKGFRLFENVHSRSHELERALASLLSDSDIEAAARVLSTLHNFLEGQI